jgi:zinc and cadmium transporter
MPLVVWITVAGVAMAAIALVGSVTLVLSEAALKRLLLPLVALAAGSLLGGALFHLLPEAVAQLGNELDVYVAVVAGLVVFFLLEQFLHWHHCHQPVSRHRPVGYLILLADGVHNLIGGLAVGGAFVVDVELGLVAWLVAAAHEVPQELGDFGILVHSGWSRRAALLFNLASGLTFLVGAWIAYALSGALDVALLLPFAAGNFLYIAVSDLLPQLRSEALGEELVQFAAFCTGLLLLGVLAAACGTC